MLMAIENINLRRHRRAEAQGDIAWSRNLR
jgi:hypothetical protein